MAQGKVAVDKKLIGRNAGVAAGCPFCLAQEAGTPKVGMRIRILTGSLAGREGVVLEICPDTTYAGKGPKLTIQDDNEPSGHWWTVYPQLDPVLQLPATSTPMWAPPISLHHAFRLDKAVVDFCYQSLEFEFYPWTWQIDWPAFYCVIEYLWYNQLPVEPEELWAVLEAHGVPPEQKDCLLKFYERGRGLLIHSVGRKPFNPRRVIPRSVEQEDQNKSA